MMISRLRLERPDAVDITKLLDGGNYWVHQEMSRLFAGNDQQPRPFLYRRDDRDGRPECLVVSGQPPVVSAGAWSIETKPYSPRLRAGERLAFCLRANPVVTRRVGPDQRHSRHDIVMDAKRQHRDAGNPPVGQAELCQVAGLAWIRRKGERHGFVVIEESMVVGGYRQHVIAKRNRQPICISTLEFVGMLEVSDIRKFHETLSSGIGPAKGFGCGLLLVKRV